uniref:PT-TG domain-containing protein n=1 Tax=Strongyloides stercoralis TaxID=6248 RepID=A0A0K0EM67_STRER
MIKYFIFFLIISSYVSVYAQGVTTTSLPQLSEEEFAKKLNEKYYDGHSLNIPIGEDAVHDLHRHWSEQAISGLMAAVSSYKMHLMKKDAKNELEFCSKKAYNIKDHARCVSKALESIEYRKSNRWTIFTGKSKKSMELSTLHRSKRGISEYKVRQSDNYQLKDKNDQGILTALAKYLQKTVLIVKNKNETKGWRRLVNEVKAMGKQIEMEDSIQEQNVKKFGNTIAKNLLRKTKEEQDAKVFKDKYEKVKDIRLPLKILREAVKVGMNLGGANTTDFDAKTLKLLSPRFLSLVPDQTGNDTVNLLSPSLFSLHGEGENEEKLFSLKKLLGILSPNDQDAWLDFIVEAAGVSDSIEKKEKLLKEKRKNEMIGMHGEKLYFTKENVTKRFGDEEKRKIEVFEKLSETYSKKQVSDLDKKGFALLSKSQIKTVYGDNSPYNSSEALQNLSDIDEENILEILIKSIRDIADGKLQSNYDIKDGRRRKRAIVSSPFLLTPLTFAGTALSQPIVLSPLVLSPITLSPAVLGPIVLSPWVFIPLVLSPRVLSPLILSPLVGSPIILSPLVLHPLILVPGVMNPFVLSPFVLSPFILSPQALTPVILSPFALSPLILTPMVLSPLVLSPFVLSPIILSPQALFAVVLSPYALSPLVESKLIASEVVLSPSWLS